jgi:WbqC-like protein family
LVSVGADDGCESQALKCVILQPSYIPWRGYFHQIQKADIFMFYDDVQYDVDGWRNRNRVKTAAGTRWLTIPVLSRGVHEANTAIREMRISWDRHWARKHLSTLRQSYAQAPFFPRYRALIEGFYERHDDLIADFTIDFTVALAAELGVKNTRFLRSSELSVQGTKTDRLLALLGAVGADHYISGPSAKDYIDESKVREAGVTLEFMSYDYPEYDQLYPPYDPAVSVLDLLFMKGEEAGRYIWGGTEEPA